MCGVFGIRSVERDVARLSYFALFALQHRGQESAGIAVSEGGRLTVLRDMGLVAQVFNEQQLQALPGEVAIGHTRYSTTGGVHWSNAQPLVHHGRARTVAIGHNGNLTNSGLLREGLVARGIRLGSTSDTEVIGALIANDDAPLADAVAAAMGALEGAYSVAALVGDTLVAFRDPHGIRPLALGRIGDDWVVASESCALDLIGAEVERDVRPGEIVLVDGGGLRSVQALPEGQGALCIFEHVYFARPDSRLGGTEVHGARVRMGERLAREAPATRIDVNSAAAFVGSVVLLQPAPEQDDDDFAQPAQECQSQDQQAEVCRPACPVEAQIKLRQRGKADQRHDQIKRHLHQQKECPGLQRRRDTWLRQ